MCTSRVLYQHYFRAAHEIQAYGKTNTSQVMLVVILWVLYYILPSNLLVKNFSFFISHNTCLLLFWVKLFTSENAMPFPHTVCPEREVAWSIPDALYYVCKICLPICTYHAN